jgi:dolichol-phosphate mannosyltransferase
MNKAATPLDIGEVTEFSFRDTRLVVMSSQDLAVVVPVLNERDNIRPLVERLREALAGISWELIFVDDDSHDGTRDAVAEIGHTDSRVRLLHRIGRRGLSTAFIEGAQASLAPYIAAIDGDLQHDETLLPEMLSVLGNGDVELVIGSRYLDGGGMGEWDQTRVGMSAFATKLSHLVLRAPITDPMSGFFMIRRETFDRAVRGLSAVGFKILLDIVASLPVTPVIRELPYRFRARTTGESKLDAGVLRDYVILICDKMFGHVIPMQFLLFAGVGLLGIGAHLVVLRLALWPGGLSFPSAQAVATASAILGNFVLNNIFTFRDRRLKGRRFLLGLVTFALVCSVGAAGNIGVASFLFGPEHTTWWLAGIAGAVMSLVWNYAVSSAIAWRQA